MMMMSIDDLPEADGKEAEIHAHASCSIKKKKREKDSRVVKNARLVRHAFVRSKSRTKGEKKPRKKDLQGNFKNLCLVVFVLLLLQTSSGRLIQNFAVIFKREISKYRAPRNLGSDLVIEELKGAKACKEVISPLCVYFACLLSFLAFAFSCRERERERERENKRSTSLVCTGAW
jgi:hypothetical protein